MFFEQKIRPLLVTHCYECHSTEKKVRGGLKLDSRAGWQAGGDSGEVIVPGKPQESALIEAFKYGGDRGETAGIREAQLMTLYASGSLPNTGMAVTMDIGDPKDIHPTEKREVGRRLALWALAKDYGKTGLVCSGPLFYSSEIKGGAVRVKFEHAKSGLLVKGDRLTNILIAGADRKFKDANVRIEGDTLVVSSPMVEVPAAVRYGWEDACEPNLFNNDGLPASPFRTDDWPITTER